MRWGRDLRRGSKFAQQKSPSHGGLTIQNLPAKCNTNWHFGNLWAQFIFERWGHPGPGKFVFFVPVDFFFSNIASIPCLKIMAIEKNTLPWLPLFRLVEPQNGWWIGETHPVGVPWVSGKPKRVKAGGGVQPFRRRQVRGLREKGAKTPEVPLVWPLVKMGEFFFCCFFCAKIQDT